MYRAHHWLILISLTICVSCGDGRVDSLWGETCDDGNVVSNDGCSLVCKLAIDVD